METDISLHTVLVVGGDQSSPPISPDCVEGVPIDAVSVELSSSKPETTATDITKHSIVNNKNSKQRYNYCHEKGTIKTAYKHQRESTGEIVKIKMKTEHKKGKNQNKTRKKKAQQLDGAKKTNLANTSDPKAALLYENGRSANKLRTQTADMSKLH